MGIFQPQAHVIELYQGGWQQRLADAAEAAERAKRAGGERLPATLDETEDPNAEYLSLVDEYESLREQAIAEGIVRVTVERMDPEAWEDLVEAHPPREGADVPKSVRESDAKVGVNERTFRRPLVAASVVKIEPEMTLDELLTGISSVQLDDIYNAAFVANRGRGFDPKDAPDLKHSPSSNGTGN